MQRSNAKNVFITGGTGFIGRRLIPLLVRSGWRVTALYRNGRAPRQPGVRWVRGDLNTTGPWVHSLRGMQAVIHLASDSRVNHAILHPREALESNTRTLLSLLEAVRAQGARPLVLFASTDRLYGATKKRVITESEPAYPIEPYTASKIIGEIILETYRHLYGIPYIAFRMDGTYGPGQPERMFIANVARKMLASGAVRVGKLGVRKNFVYVDDVADAFLRGLRAPARAQNRAYTIAAEPVTLQKIADILTRLVKQRTGRAVQFRYDPSLVRNIMAEVRPFRADTSLARRLLGWQPRTSLARGLAATLDDILSPKNKSV